MEEQVRQHNEKRTAAVSETSTANEDSKKIDDTPYEVTLDDDFLTALECGMPPDSGMVWSYLNLCLIFMNCLYCKSRHTVFCLILYLLNKIALEIFSRQFNELSIFVKLSMSDRFNCMDIDS